MIYKLYHNKAILKIDPWFTKWDFSGFKWYSNMRSIHFFLSCKGIDDTIFFQSRVSQFLYYWHFGPGNSLFWEAVFLCIMKCLTTSLYPLSSRMQWQKMSADTVKCPRGPSSFWMRRFSALQADSWKRKLLSPAGGGRGSGEGGEGLNVIRVHYIHVWKCDNETINGLGAWLNR
jgi:hypothetical protein